MKLVSSTMLVFAALSALTYHYVETWGEPVSQSLEVAAADGELSPSPTEVVARLP